MNKDIKCIPKGFYCYYSWLPNNKILRCPYWRKIKERPEHYNGWCDFLEKGDLEIMKETETKDVKTGKIIKTENLPFPVSLLWDMCKECGINEEEDEI